MKMYQNLEFFLKIEKIDKPYTLYKTKLLKDKLYYPIFIGIINILSKLYFVNSLLIFKTILRLF